MLSSMAIRMKEWGLQAYPRQGVHLPVNALNDWGRSGRVLGQGVEDAGRGLATLAPAIAQVVHAGQSADTAAMLDEIGRETAAELMEMPVRDWDYSWSQAYAPRVQEMLSLFTGEEREEARRLSEVYGARYSLEGRRNLELERIRLSRSRWQEQVESAVLRGDSEAACEWVEQGRGVFVPEEEMQHALHRTRSRSLQNTWQRQLQQNPHSALEAWQRPDAGKPEGEEELRLLENQMKQTRADLYNRLAEQLSMAVEQGEEPDSRELERAVAAGLIPADQVKTQYPCRALETAELCNWMRRIDEHTAGEETQLKIDIATAPIPAAQRQLLLQRVCTTSAVSLDQRLNTSRTLWNLYRRGHFGCPGDEQAMRCLGRLQEDALQRLVTRTEKETASWLEHLCHSEDDWVCFDSN